MATDIKSKKGLLRLLKKSSPEIQQYFEHLPRLLDGFPLHVALSYAFARLELGQNMALYCGVVKVHRAHAEVARAAVGTQHMTREGFVSLYRAVFDRDLPKVAASALKTAELTRDAVMHGKDAADDRIRNAIARVIEYADAVNNELQRDFGIRPFGNLKGFAGRAKKLDQRTSRFMLKGMGFNLS